MAAEGYRYHGKEGDDGFRLLRFLNAIMYPHKENFMDTISEYIDFSNNEELWKEAERMDGLGQSILEEGIEQGLEQGIQCMVESLQEMEIPYRKTEKQLLVKFALSEEAARKYMDKFWK